MKRFDNTVILVETTVQGVFNDNKNLLKIEGIIDDITERQELELKLRQALRLRLWICK